MPCSSVYEITNTEKLEFEHKQVYLIQELVGKCEQGALQEIKKSTFVEFSNFSGVNIPIMADFKLPMDSCNSVEAGSSIPLI